MARATARMVPTLAGLLYGGGLLTERVPAQQPLLHVGPHPYFAIAYRNAHPGHVPRPAARFSYNPYYPGLAVASPRRKPFDGVEVLRPRRVSPSGDYGAMGYQLEELAAEYRYYGFGDFAEDLAYP